MSASDRYHALTVAQVVSETDDAVSLVFDVPTELALAYEYASGQSVTLRVEVDGERLFRSYSMSSCPAANEPLRVTVKRVADGVVSNWIYTSVQPGDVIDVSVPTGVFVLEATATNDVVAFAGGSGITPIFSIIKTALHTTDRRVRLFFANRDRDAAIFGNVLDALAAEFGERLQVLHHEDVHAGFATVDNIEWFLRTSPSADVYICGPGPFMDIVEKAVATHDDARVFIERFVPSAAPTEGPAVAGDEEITVTITLNGRSETTTYRPGNTLLQTARWAGLTGAPSSCEAGHCATCMAQVTEGTVEMRNNEALTPEEVAEGWVLTCQGVPTSPVVKVVYE